LSEIPSHGGGTWSSGGICTPILHTAKEEAEEGNTVHRQGILPRHGRGAEIPREASGDSDEVPSEEGSQCESRRASRQPQDVIVRSEQPVLLQQG